VNTASRLYDVEVFHHRQSPIAHEVRQRMRLVYADVDALPHVSHLARIDAADHVGDPKVSIRANIEALLAQYDIDINGGQITMLTQLRVAGYVFNPLTLYWCHQPSGALECVVAEVHNTYGGRHAYVVRPDAQGRADTVKEFYVSPFYPVDGYYRMSVPEPGERLSITITLHRSDEPPFVASMRGVGRPLTRSRLLALATTRPLATYAVRAGITWHGIRLYRKGLPVVRRTEDHKTSRADIVARLYQQFTGTALPVRIRMWDDSTAGPAADPTVVLRSRRALRRITSAPGELGLARAYVSGDIDVDGDLAEGLQRVWTQAQLAPDRGAPKLTRVQRLQAVVAAARLGAIGWRPKPPAIEARVVGRVHSRGRDRAVIAHHYDLSNRFYELILDESMAYSAAYFTGPDQSLADAQRAKLDLICAKLQLTEGMRLLDVGCGWGSLILHAAEHYGVTATGVTLSAQQLDFVQKRIAERGLSDRVTVQLCDYRDLEITQPFDAVASIEMGEHVGEQNYPQYVATLHRALAPGARLLLQQMSRRSGTAPGGGPFIEAYIAPDMHMRPVSETIGFLERADFEVIGLQNLRTHYARTAYAWRENFEANYDELVALAGEAVARVWRLYLIGGAMSFADGRMGVDQILSVRT
jgi:cyclopropane fatty-acyl-phospholipid synthase-like methyltransferase/DUF1365 family protein